MREEIRKITPEELRKQQEFANAVRELPDRPKTYFIVTYESPIVLNKTNYNDLFSSQFSVWKEEMIQICDEFNENLNGVWNQKIQRHEEKENAVVITYEDGSRIYINYSEESIIADGVQIPAKDYVLVKGSE